MSAQPVLRSVDAVTLTVPDLDAGLRFYRDALGHELLWRNDELGQAGLRCPESATEIVIATGLPPEPNWLVRSVAEAIELITAAGGQLLSGPIDIPVGRVAAVSDPFGNRLVLVELSKGLYTTDEDGQVTGVAPER
ncbi:VOC family protein [Kribbella sp. HUAS MG21]|uniref:VOC family protein n=1 Tax=Kribbella sp. HUAS MG21 TaxID=3160966 RepID=A0AAU7TDA3_9ACTN